MRGVLIIDDNRSSFGLEGFLRDRDYSPIIVDTVDEGLQNINESETLKVVLLNVELSAERGWEALRRIKGERPEVIVIVIGSGGQTARRATRLGALEVLSHPIDIDGLLRALDRAFARLSARGDTSSNHEEETFEDRHTLVGESEPMFELNRKIGRAASFNISVLLGGETGTGKGLVARLIHQESDRAGEKFVTVDCGALPDPLLENELFGHERGAFTGARREGRPGAFQRADGGTLFLDEVGNMTSALQESLLNVLQEREVQRVGGTETHEVDVRIISATHQNLTEMVAQGEFREDLYYRLCGYEIELPSLRERIEDIPALVTHFLRRIEEEENRRPMYGVAEEVMALLQRYNWPGNVRELDHCLKSATVISQGDAIMPSDLPERIQMYSGNDGAEGGRSEMRSSETAETPIPKNLLDLPVAAFCQFISNAESGVTDPQIAEWWVEFSNDGRDHANRAKREINNWWDEWHTTELTFPDLSERIKAVIDNAISQLSLRHRMDSEPIAEAEPVSIIGRTLKGSLTAILHEVVNSHGGNRERAARELRISLRQLERWLSYRSENDDSLWTSIAPSRRLERFSRGEIKRLLREPINFFILENFSRREWRNRNVNGQMRTVHLTLKVLSKRLAEDHGYIYFGGMTFSQIEWNIYRRAPYLYDNHAEAAEALNVDIRTFRRYCPERDFPCHYTLFTGWCCVALHFGGYCPHNGFALEDSL
ncbi:MAG: sigma-54 dependent transcriptional regulator [Candidatus Poribacteria bacterium]|nr:sigma-54 dependent transcriptional regulator [Candidatus Poribacteria bacterium]